MAGNTGWQGGPNFYKVKKYGQGAKHSGPSGRKAGRSLPAILRALAEAWCAKHPKQAQPRS